MRARHIIDILDRAPLASLKESELAEIRTHIAACPGCRRAYEAAQISALLLREQTTEVFEPSPFFHSRVLAGLRQRQTANEAWTLGSLWRATGALVPSMTATVALLAALSFLVPSTQPEPATQASALNLYSAEEVILNQNELPNLQTSDAQVLTTLYQPDEDATR
jgi:hypothetical protein